MTIRMKNDYDDNDDDGDDDDDVRFAVVTGATDGIGKGYARRLASRKMNLVLVGRSPEKLDRVASEIGEPNTKATPSLECRPEGRRRRNGPDRHRWFFPK